MASYSITYKLPPVLAPAVFNPEPRIHTMALSNGQAVYVIDDFVQNPNDLVALAESQSHRFFTPKGHPYPGPQLLMPKDYSANLAEFFQRHFPTRLQWEHPVSMYARFSRVTQDAATLDGRQRICHRDNTDVDPKHVISAMVHYLFHDEQLGGTVFFRPLKSVDETQNLFFDACNLDGDAFGKKYGVPAAYMTSSNAYFEVIGRVNPKFNRAIFYDGEILHSGDIKSPVATPNQSGLGRLTINGFFTSTKPIR